jgi:ArsR family transcriptional regulator
MRAMQGCPAFSTFPGEARHDNIMVMKMSDAVSVLDALAQENRLHIFRFLIRMGAVGAPAGRIGEQLGVHSATLSFHLNALRQAGLVTSRRESRSIIYTANFARMSDLMAYLMENCCQGDRAAGTAPLLSAGGGW